MAIIKCKMCGGDIELTADKTFGTCEFCGSTMTLPKIDDDQRAAAFNRGNHFRRIGEFDKALSVYERIVREDDTDAEAHWCCALCRFGIEYVEDPATFEWLPTCHRASFDSFLEDVDYKAAVEYSDGITKRQYMKDGAKIAEVQRGILATSQNAEPYDVFICYKESDENGQRTRDSLMAQDIYYQLTEQGRKVFFARITLEDVVGTQYEPYIFAALNSAKVMIVVGTKPEYLNAVWVKNEWSRFLAMMKKDRHKLLLPCYREMDPYDMPEQLSVLQSYDMSKIGFVQDLTRGIAKVLDADKKQEQVKETVVVQQAANNNVPALLKRGNMALEDGDWDKADEFFEEVLNQDAECAEAYIGKTLVMEKCSTIDVFVQKKQDQYQNARGETLQLVPNHVHVNAMVQKLSIENYVSGEEIRKLYGYNLSYHSDVGERKSQLKAEEAYWSNHKYLTRAEKFATGTVAEMLAIQKKNILDVLAHRVRDAENAETFSRMALQKRYENHIKKADGQAEEIHQNGLQRKENYYKSMLQIAQNETDVQKLKDAAKEFDALGNYKDSKSVAEHCRKRAEEEQGKLDEQNNKLILLREKQAEARRQKNKRIAAIVAAVAAVLMVVFLIVTRVVIPNIRYNNAEALLENGKYQEATEILVLLDGYKKSADIIQSISALEKFSNGEVDEGVEYLLSSGMEVSIFYNTNGGHNIQPTLYQTVQQYSGLQVPEYEGYRFVDWSYVAAQYQAGGCYVLTFIANWTDGYCIKYELNGGIAENPDIYHKDGDTVKLNRPNRQGYTFVGWTGTDLDEATLDVEIPAGSYGDREYTANWKPNEYTFTLDANGGAVNSSSVSAFYDDPYTLPIPTRDYYQFAGWYDGTTKYENGTWNKASNVTLTAKWQLISYTITYNLDGGSNSSLNPKGFTVFSGKITLNEPIKEGYKFIGWYTDSSYSKKITEIPAGSHEPITLYAKWEIITYTITYKLNGGSISGTKKTTFTVKDLPITLPTASKSGMEFLYWSIGTWDGKIIDKITGIGDITVVAVYMDPGLLLKLAKDGSYYIVDDYTGSHSEVIIPPYYNGKPVKEIDDYAFCPNDDVVTIRIPSTVNKIGGNAFWGCSKLKNINIPNGITEIDISTFADCKSLVTIVIPESVTEISSSAFEGCTSLRNITLPSKLERIGFSAFEGCTSLKKIIIPASVTIIDDDAFWNCPNLTIYCRAKSEPSSLVIRPSWNCYRPVVWGYTGD